MKKMLSGKKFEKISQNLKSKKPNQNIRSHSNNAKKSKRQTSPLFASFNLKHRLPLKNPKTILKKNVIKF